MGNHYHLVVHTPDARISSALQQLHTWYSRHHNRVHGRSAHLFRAHFMAREISSDQHLLAACRYLALNPVRAGLASHLRAAFDNHPDWQQRYAAEIEAANDEDPPKRASVVAGGGFEQTSATASLRRDSLGRALRLCPVACERVDNPQA